VLLAVNAVRAGRVPIVQQQPALLAKALRLGQPIRRAESIVAATNVARVRAGMKVLLGLVDRISKHVDPVARIVARVLRAMIKTASPRNRSAIAKPARSLSSTMPKAENLAAARSFRRKPSPILSIPLRDWRIS
jgi:hypothetical protein